MTDLARRRIPRCFSRGGRSVRSERSSGAAPRHRSRAAALRPRPWPAGAAGPSVRRADAALRSAPWRSADAPTCLAAIHGLARRMLPRPWAAPPRDPGGSPASTAKPPPLGRGGVSGRHRAPQSFVRSFHSAPWFHHQGQRPTCSRHAHRRPAPALAGKAEPPARAEESLLELVFRDAVATDVLVVALFAGLARLSPDEIDDVHTCVSCSLGAACVKPRAITLEATARNRTTTPALPRAARVRRRRSPGFTLRFLGSPAVALRPASPPAGSSRSAAACARS